MPQSAQPFSRRSFVAAGSAALLGLTLGAVEPARADGVTGAELVAWSRRGATVRYPGGWQVIRTDSRSIELAPDPLDEISRVRVSVDAYAAPVDSATLLALKVQETIQDLQSTNGWLLTRVHAVQEGTSGAGTRTATVPFWLDRVDDREKSLQGIVHLKTDGATLVTCSFVTEFARWSEIGFAVAPMVLSSFVEIDPGARYATTHFAMSGVEDVGAGVVALYNAGGVVGEGKPLVENGALYSTVQVGLELAGFDPGTLGVYVDGRIAETYDIPDGEPHCVALTLDEGPLMAGTHTVEVARLEGDDVLVYKKIRYTAL